MLGLHQYKKFLCSVLLGLMLFTPVRTFAQDSVAGKQYKTLIYASDIEKASTTITFADNSALLIAMYEGFGVYVPVGQIVVGFFSAPKYNKVDDLVLLISRVVVADFLSGIGISLQNFQYAGIFAFFGYAI